MGIRNRKREVIQRLESKTLDSRFTTEIEQGLNCSPFQAEAVLGVVKEVYFPFISATAAEPAPGKISLLAVAADEPAGKPVANCKKQSVCLTLHRGTIDDLLFHNNGPAGFRQARILDLCQQALSQAHCSLPKTSLIESSSSLREPSLETSSSCAKLTLVC